jgi:cell division protein FtsB
LTSSRQDTRNDKPDRYLYWLVGGVCAILLGAAILGRDGLLAVIVNQRRIGELRGDVVRLHEENRVLQNQIQSLRSDLTYIERIAREDLGLVKPGETVYEFIPAGKRGGGKAGKQP